MTESVPKKPNIAEISPHLICALCGGYLIDATTIVECLHSFCKTCIVRYLESSKYCPICEVLVHKTRPLQNIRLDQTLQNIVYKLVPGLFQSEMRRRREFYKDHPTVRSAKTRQEQQRERIIYSADENFSISLDYCHDGRIRKPSSSSSSGRRSRRQSKPHGPERRYLLCPAPTTVALLKKFIRLKFALPTHFQVEMCHMDGPLLDHYSLMDVAYIYSWKREGVLQLYYSIFKHPEPTPAITPAITLTEIKEETTSELAAERLADDNRPSSLFSKASLLGKHSMNENLHHDLSPLELIATVANDISCLQEGRGLKRKPEAAQLYENDDDNSSTETQIKRSVERAIDLCETSGRSTPVGSQDNKTSVSSKPYSSKPNSPKSQFHENRFNKSYPSSPLALPRTNSPRRDNQTDVNENNITSSPSNMFTSPGNARYQMPGSAHLLNPARDTVIQRVETKEKPKKTDTASQCEAKPKKHKSEMVARSLAHSKQVQGKSESNKITSKTDKDTTSSNGGSDKKDKASGRKSDKSAKTPGKKIDKVHDKKQEKSKKTDKTNKEKPNRTNEKKVDKTVEKKPDKTVEKKPDKTNDKKQEKPVEKKPEAANERKADNVFELKFTDVPDTKYGQTVEKSSEKVTLDSKKEKPTLDSKKDKSIQETRKDKPTLDTRKETLDLPTDKKEKSSQDIKTDKSNADNKNEKMPVETKQDKIPVDNKIEKPIPVVKNEKIENANSDKNGDETKVMVAKHKLLPMMVDSPPKVIKTESVNSTNDDRRYDKVVAKNGDSKLLVRNSVEVKTEQPSDLAFNRGSNSPFKPKDMLKAVPKVNGHASPNEIVKQKQMASASELVKPKPVASPGQSSNT